MQYLFGIVTVWFVVGAALLIRDANQGNLAPITRYPAWPKWLWRLWTQVNEC